MKLNKKIQDALAKKHGLEWEWFPGSFFPEIFRQVGFRLLAFRPTECGLVEREVYFTVKEDSAINIDGLLAERIDSYSLDRAIERKKELAREAATRRCNGSGYARR